MTHEHIRDAILAMDETVLTPERLSQLAKVRHPMSPTRLSNCCRLRPSLRKLKWSRVTAGMSASVCTIWSVRSLQRPVDARKHGAVLFDSVQHPKAGFLP